MKKVVFGLMVLGVTNLVVAQSSVKEFNIKMVPAYNAPYLETVSDGFTPAIASDIQLRAANFDPSVLKDFSTKEKGYFEVVHKASNGEIITFYDNTGRIVSTMERFTDVTLPLDVREQVFEGNEEWIMIGNKYKSDYQNGRLTKKIYQIQLQNGEQTKNVIVDVLDNHGE